MQITPSNLRKIMSLLNITFFVGKTGALKTSIYPFKTYKKSHENNWTTISFSQSYKPTAATYEN